ncbi:hypothetical protein, partial [Streptococcus gallolyticus]|uniref:hypothetical protein n=1 Tax=Streptococcus gallolyticus TaxID=315405 RepID=UPI001E40DDE1
MMDTPGMFIVDKYKGNTTLVSHASITPTAFLLPEPINGDGEVDDEILAKNPYPAGWIAPYVPTKFTGF